MRMTHCWRIESVGPAPPRGRDKSGPYGLDIASLVVFGQFANSIRMTVKHDFVRGEYGAKQGEKGIEEN